MEVRSGSVECAHEKHRNSASDFLSEYLFGLFGLIVVRDPNLSPASFVLRHPGVFASPQGEFCAIGI
jgi:hypothetical protein